MIIRIRLLLAALLVFFSGGHTFAQQVVSYSTTDGLAHSDVRYLLHDPDGYLWIGTWDGLSRFDGHSFQNYHSKTDDSTAFTGSTINIIAKDNNGFIWVVTGPGWQIARYNPQTDDFSNLEFARELQRFLEKDVDLVFDNHGNGWFINDEGLYWFDPVSLSSRIIDFSDFHKHQSSLVASDEGLWIATSEGLFLLPYNKLKQKERIIKADAIKNYPFENAGSDLDIGELLKMQNGVFLLLATDLDKTTSKLYASVTDASLKLQELPLPRFHQAHNPPQALYINQIAPNKILVSTGYPAFAVFDAGRMAYEYDHPLSEYFINRIHRVAYPDHQHNLWVGGHEGMVKYSNPQLNLKSWVFDPSGKDGLSGRRITALYKDDQNRLWVGSRDGGLDLVNLTDQTISKIVPTINTKPDLQLNSVLSIIPLNDEEVLINFDKALLRYHLMEKRFSFFKNVDFLVYSHLTDSRGRIWISERGKLSVFDKDDLSLIKEFYGIDFCQFPTNSRQIFEAKNGQFWVCCGEGLVKLNYETPEVSRLFVPPGSESHPEVICMHERADGILWLGTLKYGIYAFDPATETFTAHYSTENGLIDNSVNKIYEDKKGYLWMSTWKGIARFNIADSSLTNYSVVNGLPFPEFNTNAHIMDDDGTIYFGGEGGVVAFHPDSLVNFEIIARPGITSINAGNGMLPLNYPLRDGAVVGLPHDQNSISLNFSAFDLRHPENRMYRYRLNGWSDAWRQNNSGDLTAHFAGLKPGKYLFELQSTYKGWPWILEKTSVQINVAGPPFYLSGAFHIVMAIFSILALIVVMFLLVRNYKIRKEVQISRLEREANQSKLNFLKSQMNPHFYFNTLNAINSFVLQNDTRAANKFLSTFARLMREILENSQKEFVTVAREIEVLEKYLNLQQLRFPGLFEYSIEASNDIMEMLIPPMLLQPFVENSVEYAFTEKTEKGFISVRFTKTKGNLVCEVTDNGIGISRSKEIKTKSNRKSTALINIANRIGVLQRIYNVSIDMKIDDAFPEKDQAPGTHIQLILPDFQEVQKAVIPEHHFN